MVFWPVKKKKLTFARAGHWVGKLLTFVVTWVVKVGLPMSLEVTCDVGSTQHFAADAAGHFAFMPDHMGAQAVFGSESRGTGLKKRERGKETRLNSLIRRQRDRGLEKFQ